MIHCFSVLDSVQFNVLRSWVAPLVCDEEELLLADDEHHVATDGAAKVALFQEALGEGIEVGDLGVVLVRELIDGQEALVGIEGEVAGVVVREVVGAVAVADDEDLHEAEQRLRVAVAGVVLVFDDLLHGPAGIHAEGLQLDLHAGHAIDEQDDIVTVVAVVRVDAELVDHLEGVFAPVFEVHQGVVQRRAVVAGEAVHCPEGLRRGEDVGGDDLIQQAGELGIREADAVQGLELLAEVLFQRGAVGDVGPVVVFQPLELTDEAVFDAVFLEDRRWCVGGLGVGGLGRRIGHERGSMAARRERITPLASGMLKQISGAVSLFSMGSSSTRRPARNLTK